MNSYIYEITNTITKEQFIGVRRCEGDIYTDKYKGEDTFLPKYFRKYGKKNFTKRVLAVIIDDKMEDKLIELYMKSSKYTLIDNSSIANFKMERTTVGAKNGASRRVICLNTGEIFDTITEASKKYNTDRTGIIHACNPDSGREFAGKGDCGEYLRWKYYDAYLAESNGEKYDYLANKKGPTTGNTKPVRCKETGEEFNSMKEAAKRYGIAIGSISESCTSNNMGTFIPDTLELLHWEYINEKDNKYYDERYANKL